MILCLLLGAIYGATIDSNWRGNTELHTIMEIVALLMAAIVAMIALMSFYSEAGIKFLWLGLGFLGTMLLDGYHSIVTSSFFIQYFPSTPEALIPWSWSASRIFLAVMIWLSSFELGSQDSPLSCYRSSTITCIHIITGLFTLLCFSFFAFARLPTAYYPDLFFGRPQEFLPAIFFAAAAYRYWSTRNWQTDLFEYYVLASLVIGLFCQALFMSRSTALFDSMFDLAHLLKIVSYFTIFAGLTVNTFIAFRLSAQAKILFAEKNKTLEREMSRRHKIAVALRKTNIQLRESSEALKDQKIAALKVAADVIESQQKLQEEIIRREKLEAELKNQAALLEERVSDRTQEVTFLLQQKDAFIARLGHDLKTPLTPLIALLPLLESRLPEGKNRKVASLAIQQCEIIKNIVSQTLRLAELNTRQKYANFDQIDIREEVGTILAGLKHLTAVGKVSFNNTITSPIQVMADAFDLQEVLQNLITNAIKYSRTKTLVIIGAQQVENLVTISISDNGIGMTQEQLDRSFEEYWRADPARHDTDSHGIGLNICKRIIESHGGKIWVTSPGLGKGCTFFFTLKAAALKLHSTEGPGEPLHLTECDSETSALTITRRARE